MSLQGLLAAALLCMLGYNVAIIWQGHHLAVHEQMSNFAKAHKNAFLGIDTIAEKQQPHSIQGNQALPKTTINEGTTNSAAYSNAISDGTPPLSDVRILVAVASYDFNQIPHLEELLDGYHDVACAGAAAVDVVVHTTVVYPVVWLDMFNTRFTCTSFSLTFSIQNKSLRLHLVDVHRELFYERLNDYDLFVYTEDDIRVSPTTVEAYWKETRLLREQLGEKEHTNYNVGIVR